MIPIPTNIAPLFFLHLKSAQLAFVKMLVFILFYFYFRENKEMNLGNNQEMGYDNTAGGGEKIGVGAKNAAC